MGLGVIKYDPVFLSSTYPIIEESDVDFTDFNSDDFRIDSDDFVRFRIFDRGGRPMDFSAYCQGFYISRANGCISNHMSKEKIPEYFMELALSPDSCEVLPTSSSAYAKWFTGPNAPESKVWSAILRENRTIEFASGLQKDLLDDKLSILVEKFGISLATTENVDKAQLCQALTELFFALARGNGTTEQTAAEFYVSNSKNAYFPVYVQHCTRKYANVRMIFDEYEERALADIFVCNTLTNRFHTFATRRRFAPQLIIEDATLDKLAEKTKMTLIIGNGGMGKSLMLQHLFLESIAKHEETGKLPILLELHNYTVSAEDLFTFIANTVSRHDETITADILRKLMQAGKCQILMDGIDEIDPSDETTFQRTLSELVDRFPGNQYVLASRDCGAANAINGFTRMYLMPYNSEQSQILVDKLLSQEVPELKNEIKSYLANSFIKQHNCFATNPMLLTFVIMHYPLDDTFGHKPHQFFATIYEMILSGHDAVKQAYERIFRSVDSPEEFTQVFCEFCAITFSDCRFELSKEEFESYYSKLKTVNRLSNPHKMKKAAFLHDACATACMMYETETQVLYIDRGFQQYLFAKYTYLDEPESVTSVGKKFWQKAPSDFEDAAAFEMLLDLAPEKIERYWFKPYLDEIFRKPNKNASFVRFLNMGYGAISYCCIDNTQLSEAEKQTNVTSSSIDGATNEPRSVLLSLVDERVGIESNFTLLSADMDLCFEENVCSVYVGELALNGECPVLSVRSMPPPIDGDWELYERTHTVGNCLRNESGAIRIFGYECRVPINDIRKQPARYEKLLTWLKEKDSPLRQQYVSLENYHKELERRDAEWTK